MSIWFSANSCRLINEHMTAGRPVSKVPLGHRRSYWLFGRPWPAFANPNWNKQKQNMGMCKVTDATDTDCGNVDFVTSELDYLCLVVETIIVLGNTWTSPSNYAITHSCLLTHWCVLTPQTDWNGPYMSSAAYSPLQRAAGKMLGSGRGCMWRMPWRCQVLFDFNMKAERESGTGAMVPVPSAGPVPSPPGPRRPSRRVTPEPLGKYLSYCFHCQAISSTQDLFSHALMCGN